MPWLLLRSAARNSSAASSTRPRAVVTAAACAKARRNRVGNCLRAPRIGVPIARQVPICIKLHVDVRQAGFIEDAPPQHRLGWALRTKLRYDDQWHGPSRASEIDQRSQTAPGAHDALLHDSVGTVGNQPTQQRGQAPVLVGGLPA